MSSPLDRPQTPPIPEQPISTQEISKTAKTSIIKYLTIEAQLSGINLQSIYRKITRYNDITTDFLRWLPGRDYADCEVKVLDYTAADIAKLAPPLAGLGSFLFLVTLREHPKRAKHYIAEGFPIQ